MSGSALIESFSAEHTAILTDHLELFQLAEEASSAALKAADSRDLAVSKLQEYEAALGGLKWSSFAIGYGLLKQAEWARDDLEDGGDVPMNLLAGRTAAADLRAVTELAVERYRRSLP